MTTTPIPGSVESLTDTNSLAWQAFTAMTSKLSEALKVGPAPDGLFAKWNQAADDLTATVKRLALIAPCGAPILTMDGPLFVARRIDVNDEVASLVDLTADGRAAHGTWHTDETPGEMIRYERWTRDGRIAHGYVDSVSRYIVQVG